MTVKPWMQYGDAAYVIGSKTAPGVTPRDIARSLSRINRFTGHSCYPLSVARHSLFVMNVLKHQGHGIHVQRYGLVHDIHETVVQDLGYAVKQALPKVAREAYEELANNADQALYAVLGVPWPIPPTMHAAVKEADWIAVATEKRDLMPVGFRPWDMLPLPPAPWRATPTTNPDEDAALWLWALHDLSRAANEPPLPLYEEAISPTIYAV